MEVKQTLYVACCVVKLCDNKTWRVNVLIIPWKAAGSMSFGYLGNFLKPITKHTAKSVPNASQDRSSPNIQIGT